MDVRDTLARSTFNRAINDKRPLSGKVGVDRTSAASLLTPTQQHMPTMIRLHRGLALKDMHHLATFIDAGRMV